MRSFLLSVLLAVVCVQWLPAGEVQLVPEYGFNGKSRLGAWVPVTVEIRYQPSDPQKILEGELRLHAWSEFGGGRTFVYSRPVRMGKGRKSMTMLAVATGVANPDNTQTLALSFYDTRLNKERLRQPLLQAHYLTNPDAGIDPEATLAVMLAEPTGRMGSRGWLESFMQYHEARLAERRAASLTLGVRRKQFFGGALIPADAPDQWSGYMGADVVIWHAPEAASLRPGQVEALRRWVWQGGRLLMTFSSESSSVTKIAQAIDWLPAEAGEWTAIPVPLAGREDLGGGKMSQLPSWFEAPMAGQWVYRERMAGRDPFAVLGHQEKGLPYLELIPRRGKRLWDLQASGGPASPLAVRAGYGIGSVTMAAIDPTAWPLAEHPGTYALMGRLLGVVPDPSDLDRIEKRVGVSVESNQSGSEVLLLAREYLGAAPELNPVPFWWIILFLGVYVIMVGPVDYFLLHRLNALRRTWLSLLFYVVLFSSIAYAGAYAIKGGKTFARAVGIRDEVAGGVGVRGRTFFGLYAARAERFDLDFARGGLPVTLGEKTFGDTNRLDDNDSLQYPSDGGAAMVRFSDPVQLRKVPVHKWSMKYFLADSFDSTAAAVVSGDLHYQGEDLRGNLVVESSVPLSDAMLFGRYGVYFIGELEPGAVWAPGANDTAKPLVEAMAPLAAIYWGDDQGRNFRFGRGADLSLSPLSRADQAWPTEWIAALSFPRLCETYLRPLVQEEQFSRPMPYQSLTDRPEPALPGIGAKRQGANRLPAGLSIEQVWNACVRQSERFLSDLSDVIREGGLVMFARSGMVPDDVAVHGWIVEKAGFVMHRIVFPATAAAEAGGMWQDDLYGRPYASVRESDRP